MREGAELVCSSEEHECGGNPLGKNAGCWQKGGEMWLERFCQSYIFAYVVHLLLQPTKPTFVDAGIIFRLPLLQRTYTTTATRRLQSRLLQQQHQSEDEHESSLRNHLVLLL